MSDKVAFIGSRTYDDSHRIMSVMKNDMREGSLGAVVSGGAKGADLIASRCAHQLNLEVIEYPVDTSQIPQGISYVKRTRMFASLAYERNKKIVDDSDRVYAFWDGRSNGTRHSMNYALAEGKLVYVFGSFGFDFEYVAETPRGANYAHTHMTTTSDVRDTHMFFIPHDRKLIHSNGKWSIVDSDTGLAVSSINDEIESHGNDLKSVALIYEDSQSVSFDVARSYPNLIFVFSHIEYE